jgi:hypothetical protein
MAGPRRPQKKIALARQRLDRRADHVRMGKTRTRLTCAVPSPGSSLRHEPELSEQPERPGVGLAFVAATDARRPSTDRVR